MKLDAGSTDVPTAGTRRQISNTTDRVLWIQAKANPGNTGNVALGVSDVSMTNGWTLEKTDTVGLKLDFRGESIAFSELYVDAATNGDDLDWVVLIE